MTSPSLSLSLPGSREEGRRCECSCLRSLAPASPAPQAQMGKSQLGLLTRNTTLEAGAALATGQVPALISRLGRSHLWQKRTASPALSPGFREGGSGETPEGRRIPEAPAQPDPTTCPSSESRHPPSWTPGHFSSVSPAFGRRASMVA